MSDRLPDLVLDVASARATIQFDPDVGMPEIILDENELRVGDDDEDYWHHARRCRFVIDSDAQVRELFNWLGAYLHGAR